MNLGVFPQVLPTPSDGPSRRKTDAVKPPEGFVLDAVVRAPEGFVLDEEPKGMLRRAAEAVVDSRALPIAGSIAGGILAAPSGPAAIAAAGLGGAAGEAWRQVGARALGMDAPETSTDAAKDISISGAAQAAGEATGAYVLAPLAKGAGALLKKPAGALFQLVTKIAPKDAATLFSNPKAILPGEMAKAQKAWRSVAEAAGLPVDDVSPAIINALKKDARSTVFEAFEKMAAGDAVTAAEAQTAKQALDIALMPAAKTERNKPLVALYSKMRQSFVDRIGKESPELAKANKEYAVAKAGSRFQSLLPRNQDGSPAYFRSTLPALLGLGAGNPAMAAAAMAASSPLAIGGMIAAAGAANPLMPIGRRTMTAALAELAARELRGRR